MSSRKRSKVRLFIQGLPQNRKLLQVIVLKKKKWQMDQKIQCITEFTEIK